MKKTYYILVLILSFIGFGLTTFIIKDNIEENSQLKLSALNTLNKIKDIDHQLNKLILLAHSGVILHYDEIANLTRNILYQYDIFLGQHESLPDYVDDRLDLIVEELFINIDKKINLIYSFKSSNAIFQNSSNYFPELSDLMIRYSRRFDDIYVTQLTDKINTSIYQYLVSDKNINHQRISRKFTYFKEYIGGDLPGSSYQLIKEFESHLNVILEHKESSENSLFQAIEIPTQLFINEIENYYIQGYENQLERSVFHRNLLLLFGAILLISIIGLCIYLNYLGKNYYSQYARLSLYTEMALLNKLN